MKCDKIFIFLKKYLKKKSLIKKQLNSKKGET